MSVVCFTIDTTLDSYKDVRINKKRRSKGIISLIEKMNMCGLHEQQENVREDVVFDEKENVREEVVFDNFYLL